MNASNLNKNVWKIQKFNITHKQLKTNHTKLEKKKIIRSIIVLKEMIVKCNIVLVARLRLLYGTKDVN